MPLPGPGRPRGPGVGSTTAYEDLPPIEFAFPGPLRDLLVAAVLSGAETTTTGVLADYEAAGDPLPVAGELMMIVDSAGRPVGALEVTDVRVPRPADVDLRHALDEGEGFTSVAEWRAGHESSGTARRCGRPSATPASRSMTTLRSWRSGSAW